MCFKNSRYWDERAEEGHERRLWDLFYRETERTERPLPVAEREEEDDAVEHDRDTVPVGAEP
jgi:hypothetical protein